MTNRIVETSDGGFTLEDLTEISRNVFSVGGATPDMVGVHVSTGFVSNYDQTNVPFNQIRYDPGGWWDSDVKAIVIPDDLDEFGLFIVTSQIRVDGAGAITVSPSFQIEISSTLWNYDPVGFELVHAPGQGANAYIGSVTMPLPLAPGGAVKVNGFWTGASVSLSGMLSVFRIGTLAS